MPDDWQVDVGRCFVVIMGDDDDDDDDADARTADLLVGTVGDPHYFHLFLHFHGDILSSFVLGIIITTPACPPPSL